MSLTTDRPLPATTTRPSAGRLAATLDRLASRRVWLPLAVTYAVFAGVFFASPAPFAIPVVEVSCGVPPLDVRFGASAGDVQAFLDGCGPDGRTAYAAMQLADLVYPLLFALFMASSLAMVLRRLAPTRPGVRALAMIPFVAAGFDYLENACAWLALAVYPAAAPTDGLLVLASDAKTLTSWAAGVLLLVTLAALVGRGAWRWLRPASAGR